MFTDTVLGMTTATLATNVHRERMLAFQREGKGYQFLTIVDPYLEAVPDDTHVRLLAVREYLALGLTEPARELLDDDPPAVVLPPELAALRESMCTITDARQDSSRHEATFDANLATLSARRFNVEPIRRSWLARKTHFRLFRDRHGVFQVRRKCREGWRWFPYLGNHRAVDDARELPQAVGTALMPGPYLFEGLGLGRYFERVHEATLDTFLGYSCALYIVEPDLDVFAAALHLHDWRKPLGDPRVLLFAGPDWPAELRSAWDEDTDLPFPQQVFSVTTGPSESSAHAVDVVRDAAHRREAEIHESLGELNQRYASRDVVYWASRFRRALDGVESPLRILGAVSIHTTFLQHSMRDAKRALESLGHRCVVLSEQTAHTITGPLTFHKAIRELDPDLFFVLDHIRPEFQGVVPDNLPILTWDQDQLPHVLTKGNLQRVARHDFLAGCSKSHCVAQGLDPRQFLHARVPTCPEQFSGEPLSDDEVRRYECDVSYVSHASQTPKQFHEAERASYGSPTLSRLLDVMYELLPALLTDHRTVDGGVMSRVLAEGCHRVGIAKLDGDLEERLRSWYLWRLGDRIFRHEALEWAGRWARHTGRTLRIYGRGWDKHPTLGEFAAGPAENGRELLCVYRASKINLQLMPAGFIHQRSLDGLAAGGFFLTRLCPHDLKGTTLRRLDARITQLEIRSTDHLLQHDDPELQGLLRDYLGVWLGKMDHHKYDLVSNIRLNAELPYPDEVFPDFRDVVFDSEEEFATRAERFLADSGTRMAIAERMRQVVVDRFSYTATMVQFLHAMAAYLQQTASTSTAS